MYCFWSVSLDHKHEKRLIPNAEGLLTLRLLYFAFQLPTVELFKGWQVGGDPFDLAYDWAKA